MSKVSGKFSAKRHAASMSITLGIFNTTKNAPNQYLFGSPRSVQIFEHRLRFVSFARFVRRDFLSLLLKSSWPYQSLHPPLCMRLVTADSHCL